MSNDNAEVINKFTISQNTFEDKFDKLEKDTDEMMETMDKIEAKAKVKFIFKVNFIFFCKLHNLIFEICHLLFRLQSCFM